MGLQKGEPIEIVTGMRTSSGENLKFIGYFARIEKGKKGGPMISYKIGGEARLGNTQELNAIVADKCVGVPLGEGSSLIPGVYLRDVTEVHRLRREE